jgi:hypothetical protein
VGEKVVSEDEKQFVPLVEFSAIVKTLFSEILDLSVQLMALRQAMMQQKSLPVQAEELQRLQNFFRDQYEPFQRAKHALDQAHTSIEIEELLRMYKLPNE